MNKVIIVSIGILSLSACTNGGAVNMPPTLFPRPKEVKWLGGVVKIPSRSVAVVVGDKATEPERYAADVFTRYVTKRFGLSWPVVTESSTLDKYTVLIVMGQRDTCRLLDDLCRRWKLRLGSDSPGWDGYVIHVGHTGGRTVALVGGSTPRGVVYGQDTLFQMFRKQDRHVALWPASICDWPSVKWRGRPHSDISGYDRKNTWDAFAQARINFVDIRLGKRIYGTPPNLKLDAQLRAKVAAELREAHRRGFFVFATVDCAVPKDQHDAVIQKFRELIEMGADGIYISIDDPGAEYRYGTSFDLLNRIVALGREYGITGDKLAMVPGKESYKEIATEVNYRTGHIDGLQEVLFFSTTLPSEENLKKHLRNGFATPPSWWHNWQRPRGGFSHVGNRNMRLDGKKPYMYLSPLSEGWGKPSWESLRCAGKCIKGVMPWGASLWGPEYVAHVISMWAWNPEECDWLEMRGRIYDIVYGPEAAKAAFEFDDKLEDLRRLYITSPDVAAEAAGTWPPVLRNEGDKPRARQLLAELERPYAELVKNAPSGSLLPEDVLKEDYLDAMRAEMDMGALITELPFPEYWWADHETRVAAATRIGNYDQAAIWQQQARERALQEAQRVEEALSGKLDTMDYLQRWQDKVNFRFATASRIATAPNMRGDLSDPLWKSAPPITGFGNGSERPRDQTEVRVLYTDTAFYVGFICHESLMDKLTATRTTRDSDVWNDDCVEVHINTDGLLLPKYQFVVNALGAQYDGVTPRGAPHDSAWNGNWKTSVSRFPDKWTVEIEIPFATLGISESPVGQLWMCNFCRSDRAEDFGGLAPWEVAAVTSSFGAEPAGGFHDLRKLRPLWFK